MDLELSDEQRWLSESVEALLTRTDGDALWGELVAFGGLAVGEGLGAIELCLVAREIGAHLASVPYLASAAVRYAVAEVDLADDAVALALLEPGGGWRLDAPDTVVESGELHGRKVAVEHAAGAARLAVSAAGPDGGAGPALVAAGAPGGVVTQQPGVGPTPPLHAGPAPGGPGGGAARDAAPRRG